jgi:hypothetical protein
MGFLVLLRGDAMSAKVSKKLLKHPPSGVSDMNKQNTGWRARMVWIRCEPYPINDWWNRPRVEKTQRKFNPSNQVKAPKDDNDHSLQRNIDLAMFIRRKDGQDT